LIAEIAARAKSSSCSLLFGNNGRPDDHLLRLLKQVAFDGSLNCCKCKGTVNGKEVSCVEAPVCEKWILHRFRKNFATDRHNGGAPALKIQKWLGHAIWKIACVIRDDIHIHTSRLFTNTERQSSSS